jgi:phosphohistidine swiveling domain-containing protein
MRQIMKPLSFTTKAGNLHILNGILKSAYLLPKVDFRASTWTTNKLKLCTRVRRELGNGPFAVRSSCAAEDDLYSSRAGEFKTLLNVTQSELIDAVDDVIASYHTNSPGDEVLIQPMLEKVIMSGVAFSHDPSTGASYQRIDYYDGFDTDAVTSGKSKKSWRRAESSPLRIPEKFEEIILMLEELFTFFGYIPIDVEFAITCDNFERKLWLLQVRPLVMKYATEASEIQNSRLCNIAANIKNAMQSHPFLLGKKTVFGVMPDWNPAEILGLRPQPLALSLYREMITDSIWAQQRHNYGYRSVRSFPIMRHFFGLPYIDVRVSFNSFIPATLEDQLAEKLVDYYLDELVKNPHLHDKVEFDIVQSCYTLDMDERLKKLEKKGFTISELEVLKEHLRLLTNRIVDPDNGLWKEDSTKLDILEQRRQRLLSSKISSLEKVYWLIEDGKTFGTLPFAGLARVGFIAFQLLQSLVRTGIFNQNDYCQFLTSLSTVSKKLTLERKSLTAKAFLNRYGHLRPGTYDIMSSTYANNPELYFAANTVETTVDTKQTFSATASQMKQIEQLLRKEKVNLNASELLDFIKCGIELRESAKFRFSRNLSHAIEEIAHYGADLGLSREQMAYSDIRTIKDQSFGYLNPLDALENSIELGKVTYEKTLKTSLPNLITSADDVWQFSIPDSTPNYVTQSRAIGQPKSHFETDKLKDAIICIPNADPGFDWVFSKRIKGLITAWGGANSHMAIRASELGIPAVIGAGEVNYENWSTAKTLNIDCMNKRVDVIQ